MQPISPRRLRKQTSPIVFALKMNKKHTLEPGSLNKEGLSN